jgi:uncharacterized membrane protein
MFTKDNSKLSNKGFAMAFICAALPIFLAIAGLVIDCGTIMLYKARLMTAVKFAAISATSNYYEHEGELLIRDDEDFVEEALHKNFKDARLTGFYIDPDENGERNVCQVKASAEAPLFFIPLLKEIYEDSESIEKEITISESYIARRSIN